MSRSTDCLDNALAESFYATLKRKLLPAVDWPTKVTARTAVFRWITVFYNHKRRHFSLGYRSPVDFEVSKE